MDLLHPRLGKDSAAKGDLEREPSAVATGNSLPWTLLISSGYDLCKRRRIQPEILKMIPFDNKPHAWILLPEN